MASPEEVVDRLYAALFAGDTDAALALCAPGGQWHTLHRFHEWHGTYSLEMYVREVAPFVLADALPDYAVDEMQRDELDTLLVSRVRSSWREGEGRQRGAGVMVARVEDGQVTDIWSMSADPSMPF